jgi:hypothetical protein
MNFNPCSQRRSLAEWLGELFARALFWLTLTVAGVLIVLVFLSPSFDNRTERPRGWHRVTVIFARDAVMRRTALAGALGLGVTAFVFFRSPRLPQPPEPPHGAGPVIGA